MKIKDRPSVSVREGDDIFLFVAQQGDDSLSYHVYAHRETKELRFGPYVAVDGYAFVVAFGVEGRDCEGLADNIVV